MPTRQRAAAVQMAYTATQLERGAPIWDSPDVLHWSAWQGRRMEQLRPGENTLRRLSAVEEWFLWRQALDAQTLEEQGPDSGALLQPEGLLDELRRADELIESWGLQNGAGPGAEGTLLLQLRQRVDARRAALQAAAPVGWRAGAEPDAALWFLGFDALGRADRQALQRLGARIGGRPPMEPRAARLVAAARPEQEAAVIAAWARQRLQQDPGARLLVVAPRLSHCEEPLRRHLAAQLDGAAILGGNAEDSLFVVEGGSPLQEFPLVSAARGWLHAVTGRSEFSGFSALLRSAYLGLGGIDARTWLEQWLRSHQVTTLQPAGLEVLLQRLAGAAAHGTTAATTAMNSLSVLAQLAASLPDYDTPSGWAQRWVQWLQVAGWPGELPLGGREQQVRQRFETLLGEFALLADFSSRLSAESALRWFDAWLKRAAFEPASGDVPVTVTAYTGDPLVQYDGIWVCGLSAQEWPAAPQANSFVSLPGLIAAGDDAVTASGALRRAEAAMAAWATSTTELVYSWSRNQDDAVLLPSPLLAGLVLEEADSLPHSSPWSAGDNGSAGVTRERYGLRPATAWTAGRVAAGGIRLLERQADCAFRGFALGRLQSEALELPRAGVTSFSHGIVIHEALQRLWQQLRDSQTLRARAPELEHLARVAIGMAIQRARAATVQQLPEALWHIEARRCLRLILALLSRELDRPEFAVITLEQRHEWWAAGIGLRFQIDRLDRVADGTHVLLDYKTGRPHSFDPLADRPEAPQLLAYSSALAEPISALATVHLHVDGIRWCGAADREDRLPGIAATATDDGWHSLRRRWQAQMTQLLADFAAGDARVDPLKNACEHCHLAGLCRINAPVTAADAEVQGNSALAGAGP